MKTTTKIGLVGALALSAVGYAAFQTLPFMNVQPIKKQPKPSTSSGRWANLIGSWNPDGSADIIITAGTRGVPPACEVAQCTASGYRHAIEVNFGDEIVFTVVSHSNGGATCWIGKPGEKYERIQAPAHMVVTKGGRVQCTRMVDW